MMPSDDHISAVLRQRFADRDEPPPDQALGHQENVYIIDLDRDSTEYVVKFCKRNSAHVLKYFPPTGTTELARDALNVEAHVLHAIATRTSLSVPEVIAVDLSPSGDLLPYLVMEKVPGDVLHGQYHDLTLVKQESIMAAVGRFLATLHETFQFDGCGQLQGDDTTITPADEWRWTEWCDAQWATCIERLQETRFADLVPDLETWYETQRQFLPADPRAVLVHDDYRPANVLVDETYDTITGIIDWEDILAAPPEYQLARIEFLFIDVYEFPAEHQSRLRTTLYDSYRQTQPFQPSDAYHERRRLYQLLSILWKTGNFPVTHQTTDEDLRTSLAQQRRHRIQQMIDQ